MENRNYIFLDVCGSTNTLLKETVRRSAGPVFDVVSADTQTGGRGRRGNAFFSPAGGAYFSAAYPLSGAETNVPFFTLLAGLAAAGALEALSSVPIRLKWPNDLYLNGKKLGGILTELVSVPGRNTVVVGFGINLRVPAAVPPALRDKIVYLSETGASVPEKRELIRAVTERLDTYIYIENALGDPTVYVPQINARAFLTGKRVTVKNGETSVAGTAGPILPDGSLRLFTNEGERRISSGSVEMSV